MTADEFWRRVSAEPYRSREMIAKLAWAEAHEQCANLCDELGQHGIAGMIRSKSTGQYGRPSSQLESDLREAGEALIAAFER